MKKEFKLPKGVDIDQINIDVKGNLLTVIYKEESKPIIKAGEWWYHSTGTLNLILEVNQDSRIAKCMPIYGDGINASFHGFETMTRKADMKEVKSLLMDEAVKKGYDYGTIVYGFVNIGQTSKLNDAPFYFDNGGMYLGNVCIFNYHSGKWAEIIEEKKDFYRVVKCSLKVLKVICDGLPETDTLSKVMTKQKCYKYIYDNWDKLNK
jgi:hypothetical protein